MNTRLFAAATLVLLVAPPVHAQIAGVREITASSRNVITLTTKLRYTTMIVLPDTEEILDIVCGDSDFWVISATQNIAHIKPAKEGASTNLNVVTAGGAVFSFLLTENKTGATDLKVFVKPDASEKPQPPKFYSAPKVEALQSELASAQNALAGERQRTEDAVGAFREQYPASLQFVYGQAKYEKPFLVRAIWNDGRFTYLRSDAAELPALYELKDGQPALVDFQVKHGVYVVPKVVERGYLALGKARLSFQQER